MLDTTTNNVPRFNTKKWIVVYDQLGRIYNTNKQIRFKTVLQSYLCDYSDEYIVVKGTINVPDPDNDAYNKKLALKNNAPFIICISEINKTLIYNAEDLDIVMLMYNLVEYSKNYSKTTRNLWNYYSDEPNSGLGGANNKINYSIKDSKSFDYKASIAGELEGNNTEKEVEIAVPLKYLNTFWRTLDMPLVNCKINLILTWSENCAITSKTTRDGDPDANPAVAAVNNPTNATFKITDTKFYVLVVTLLTEDDNKLIEQLKLGFKRTIKWNKYRSEMTNQTQINNLNYLIDPTFNKVSRLFALSFKNKDDKTSFSKYYTPNVEIKKL